ncbi:hypothetical protein ACVWVY_004940 [Bradyrhizobium sp. URHC0002]
MTALSASRRPRGALWGANVMSSDSMARDAECHGGDPGRVEALHGKGIKADALAAQRLV